MFIIINNIIQHKKMGKNRIIADKHVQLGHIGPVKNGQVSDTDATIEIINLQQIFEKLQHLLQLYSLTFNLNVEIKCPEQYDAGHSVSINTTIHSTTTELKLTASQTILEFINCKIVHYEQNSVDFYLSAIRKNTNLIETNLVAHLLQISDTELNNICNSLIVRKIRQPIYERHSTDFRMWFNLVKQNNGNVPISCRTFTPFPKDDRRLYGPIVLIQILFNNGDHFEHMTLDTFINTILPNWALSKDESLTIRIWKLTFSGNVTFCTQSIDSSIMKQWICKCRNWSNTVFCQFVSDLPDDQGLSLFPLNKFTINCKEEFTVRITYIPPDNITFPVDMNGCGSVSEYKYIIGGPYIFSFSFMTCFLGVDYTTDHIKYINITLVQISDLINEIRTICNSAKYNIS